MLDKNIIINSSTKNRDLSKALYSSPSSKKEERSKNKLTAVAKQQPIFIKFLRGSFVFILYKYIQDWRRTFIL